MARILSIKKEILTSYPFIIALAILALNDFVLKQAFGNWITGKLSDFAGLFVFPLLLSALLPRYFKLMHWITALGFVFWKSEYSESFIIACNNNLGLNWQRVVDYTDLIALISVVFSYFYFQKEKFYTVKISYKPVLVMAVFFSFATMDHSPTTEVNVGDNHYVVYKLSNPNFLQYLKKRELLYKNKNNICIGIDDFRKKSDIVLLNKELIIVKLDTFSIFYNDYLQYKLIDKENLIDSLSFIFRKTIFYRCEDDTLTHNLLLIDRLNLNFKVRNDSFSMSFKNSNLHGDFKYYDLDNNIFEKGYFVNGNKDSVFEVFKNNVLIEKRYYKNDFLYKKESFNKNNIQTEFFVNEKQKKLIRAQLELIIFIVLFVSIVILFIFYLNKEKKIISKSNFQTQMIAICILAPVIIFFSNIFLRINFDEKYDLYARDYIKDFFTNLVIPILLFYFLLYILKFKKIITYYIILVLIILLSQIIDLCEYFIYFFSN